MTIIFYLYRALLNTYRWLLPGAAAAAAAAFAVLLRSWLCKVQSDVANKT